MLTVTRRHRREVLRRDPRAMRQTFTLAEAAGLLPLIDRIGLDLVPFDERARDLAARLDHARARRPGGPDDDIANPVGRSLAVHREVAARIAADLRPLADVLLERASRPSLHRRLATVPS